MTDANTIINSYLTFFADFAVTGKEQSKEEVTLSIEWRRKSAYQKYLIIV